MFGYARGDPAMTAIPARLGTEPAVRRLPRYLPVAPATGRCQAVAATIVRMKDWSRTTLRERILHLAKLVGVKSQNELGRLAGIESGPMSRLARKKVAGGSLQLLNRLSAATKVSIAWLAYGQGQPGDKGETQDDRYSSRLPLIAWARAHQVSEPVIAAFASEEVTGPDPGMEYWEERLAFWVLKNVELQAMVKK